MVSSSVRFTSGDTERRNTSGMTKTRHLWGRRLKVSRLTTSRLSVQEEKTTPIFFLWERQHTVVRRLEIVILTIELFGSVFLEEVPHKIFGPWIPTLSNRSVWRVRNESTVSRENWHVTGGVFLHLFMVLHLFLTRCGLSSLSTYCHLRCSFWPVDRKK